MRSGVPVAWLQPLKLLLLWLLAGAVQAQDDPPGRVGRLAALQGEVWVLEPGQGEWVAALPNRPFTGGERLATGPGGSAELRIGSSTVFLGAQTELEALRLDDERLQFRLPRGQMALRLQSPEVAAELEVVHPEARLRALRPGLYRIDRLAEASDASVWRGELQVDGHDLSLTLYAGQRAAFWRDGALGDTTRQWLTQQEDEFAIAVQREDRALAQAPPPPVPAEMTGIEDLQRYGSWQQHPEVGAVWIPTVVAAGWAPYRQGQWVWLRPWGWTWVDAAPWGFAPFHYGRWLWWGNRWCWTPGPRLARPVFAPALVGWVGPPPAPGGVWGGRPPPPAQGWVPLGPREAYRPPYPVSPRQLQHLNPYGPAQPAAYVNRGVPGAVGQMDQLGPSPVTRPPAGHAAQQADDMAARRQWQTEQFRQDAPSRAAREPVVTPRAVVPLPTPGAGPFHPEPPRVAPPRSAGPGLAPPQAAMPGPPPSPKPGAVPAQPRPPQAGPATAETPVPMPVPPHGATRPPVAPGGEVPPQHRAAGTPAAGPSGGKPPAAGAAAREDAPPAVERGERRRTPESRGNPRER